jgi:hypothetical protein
LPTDIGFWILDFRFGSSIPNPKSQFPNPRGGVAQR